MKKKSMSPRERNEFGRQLVAKRLNEENHLWGDTVRIWTSATKFSSELLVTSANCQKKVLLRVQYSRTYPKDYPCRTSGWHDVSRNVLENTNADFFVFVCAPTKGKATAAKCHYIIIEKDILLKRLQNDDSERQKFYHIYLTRIHNSAVEVRGISGLSRRQTKDKIPEKIQEVLKEENSSQNYTEYLNNWNSIKEFLEKKDSE